MARLELRLCIDVEDLGRGVAFYTDGLGLEVARRIGNGVVELRGAALPIDLIEQPMGTTATGTGYSRRDYTRHWTPLHLDIVTGDLDAAMAKAKAAGATVEGKVREHGWGRIATLADPFGHGFCLLQFKGRGYDEPD